MDIKNLHPTADVEFKVDVKGRGGEPIKFTVRFLALDEIQDHIISNQRPRLSEVIRESLINAVVGWENITEDGKPLACGEAEKRRVLPFLCGLRVIPAGSGVEDPSAEPEPFRLDRSLAWALVEFAGDPENFLKN